MVYSYHTSYELWELKTCTMTQTIDCNDNSGFVYMVYICEIQTSRRKKKHTLCKVMRKHVHIHLIC